MPTNYSRMNIHLRGALIGFVTGIPLGVLLTLFFWYLDPTHPPGFVEILVGIAIDASLNAVTGLIALPTLVAILREEARQEEPIWLTARPALLSCLISMAIGEGVYGGRAVVVIWFTEIPPGYWPIFLFIAIIWTLIGGFIGGFTGIPLGLAAQSLVNGRARPE